MKKIKIEGVSDTEKRIIKAIVKTLPLYLVSYIAVTFIASLVFRFSFSNFILSEKFLYGLGPLVAVIVYEAYK